MRTEDLFKYGVTPKEGPFAGRQFKVTAITPTAVKVTLYDGDKAMDDEFTHGFYEIWHEPKTLFDDGTIEPTWGNLKKAVAAAGLGDETKIAVPDFIFGFRWAEIKTAKLRSNDGKEGIYIIVE